MTAPRRLALLVQFDPEGGLPPHVRIHLKGLRPIAERIVLISNSPMHDAAHAEAEGLADKVMVRENKGWDFGAWRDALAEEDQTAWDAVILTNSSVIGPLRPLAPIVAEMEERGGDFWGMVLSRLRAPHLQSYFLSFDRRVVASAHWAAFWNGVRDHTDKKQIITHYEVGLTGRLRRAGFRDEAYIPNPTGLDAFQPVMVLPPPTKLVLPMNVNRINRTVRRHLDLLEQGMPYIKASLFWGKDVVRRAPMDQIKTNADPDFPWAEIGF